MHIVVACTDDTGRTRPDCNMLTNPGKRMIASQRPVDPYSCENTKISFTCYGSALWELLQVMLIREIDRSMRSEIDTLCPTLAKIRLIAATYERCMVLISLQLTYRPTDLSPHVDAELVVALVAFVKCWQKHATRAFVMSHRFDIVIIEIYYQKKANVPKHHTPQWCPRELHYIAYVRPFLKAVS